MPVRLAISLADTASDWRVAATCPGQDDIFIHARQRKKLCSRCVPRCIGDSLGVVGLGGIMKSMLTTMLQADCLMHCLVLEIYIPERKDGVHVSTMRCSLPHSILDSCQAVHQASSCPAHARCARLLPISPQVLILTNAVCCTANTLFVGGCR